MEEIEKLVSTEFSIELPTSARRLRALRPTKAINLLRLSSGRTLDVKLAQEISSWQPIRKLELWCMTTKAALRQLLTISGLEEIYVSNLHNHSSLNAKVKPKSLHTFRGFGLSSDDLSNIAELPSLVTLSAQNSNISKAALEKLRDMEHLIHLDLEASSFDDEMAKILALSRRISHLYVGATRIGPKGLECICAMTQLRELDIWALDIQEDDLDMLTGLPNLEFLSVGGLYDQDVLTANRVLPKLALLPSLKRLWLDGISITKAQVVGLEERYEFVQVT